MFQLITRFITKLITQLTPIVLFTALLSLMNTAYGWENHQPHHPKNQPGLYPGFDRGSNDLITKRTDKWYGSFGIAANSYDLSCNLCKGTDNYDNLGFGIGLEFGRILGEKVRAGVKFNQTTINDQNNYFEFDTQNLGAYADYLFQYLYIGLGLNQSSFSDARSNRAVEKTTFSQFRFGGLFELDDAIFMDLGLGVGLTGKANFKEDFIDASNIQHGKPKFKNMMSLSVMFGAYF